jgi:maleate cis-trans isomerase
MPQPWTEVRNTIGVLVPATNTAVEIELNRILPGSFQLHVGRLQVGSVDAKGWAEQDADIDYQAQLLGTVSPALIILLQTSASFFTDGYDDQVTARITAASGVRSVTTAQALIQALQVLQARRVALVSPYSPWVSARARDYLAVGHGFDVVAVEGLNITDTRTLIGLESAPITAALERAADSDPDAYIVAGGAFQGMRFIADWEESLGRPVITTNQLAIWAALRASSENHMVQGFGRLLDGSC